MSTLTAETPTPTPATTSSTSTHTTAATSSTMDESNSIKILVSHNKKEHEIVVPLDATIKTFKDQVHKQTNVPPSLQKYILKGTKVPKDAATKLRSKEDETMVNLGLKSGTKAMLIGSTIDQVISVTTPGLGLSSSSSASSANKAHDPSSPVPMKLSQLKEHSKPIEKGVPTGAEPGNKNRDMPLPKSIQHLYDKSGQACRLTFKVDEQELWIATKDRTEKIPFAQIRDIESEAIHSNEDYHIMGFQIGSTPNSKLWFYYVPAQYHKAIKYTVLGVNNFPFIMKQ